MLKIPKIKCLVFFYSLVVLHFLLFSTLTHFQGHHKWSKLNRIHQIIIKSMKEEKRFFENFCKNRRPPCQNFDQKKKCPKVLEKVVPARNSICSIDWCKNFHETMQHDDFYKNQTDGQTNFLRIIIFG